MKRIQTIALEQDVSLKLNTSVSVPIRVPSDCLVVNHPAGVAQGCSIDSVYFEVEGSYFLRVDIAAGKQGSLNDDGWYIVPKGTPIAVVICLDSMPEWPLKR